MERQLRHTVEHDDFRSDKKRNQDRVLLLTSASISWQKGSAAQVISIVNKLRTIRGDLRFRLLSLRPEADVGPARELGIQVIDPGFPAGMGATARSAMLFGLQTLCLARPGSPGSIPRAGAVGYENVAAAYADADFVIDLSGDSYRDPPGGFALSHHVTCLAARAASKPYGLVSQSIGPFRPWNERLARYVLNRAASVYVRERRTLDLLLRLGVRPTQLRLAPDVAFLLETGDPSQLWDSEGLEPRLLPRPWVALSVSSLAVQLAARTPARPNTYLAQFENLCHHIRRSLGGSLLLIPHVTNSPQYGPDDRGAAEMLCALMGWPPWMALIRGDYSPSCLKGLISQCDALVASRMHAAIAGLSAAVPTVVVSWSHKYEGLMDDIGLLGCLWDQASHGPPSLADVFADLWRGRAAIRDQLGEYSARARSQIGAVLEGLAMDIPRAMAYG